MLKLRLRRDDDPLIVEWLQKKKSKFTSVDIQNEMLEIMALRVLREIARNIQNAVIYTIMADETADVSNKEQLVFCLRWVDDDLIVDEDFIGMQPMKGTGADQIVFLIKDILLMHAVNAMMVLQRWQKQKLALQPKLKQLMVNASIPTTTDMLLIFLLMIRSKQLRV